MAYLLPFNASFSFTFLKFPCYQTEVSGGCLSNSLTSKPIVDCRCFFFLPLVFLLFVAIPHIYVEFWIKFYAIQSTKLRVKGLVNLHMTLLFMGSWVWRF